MRPTPIPTAHKIAQLPRALDVENAPIAIVSNNSTIAYSIESPYVDNLSLKALRYYHHNYNNRYYPSVPPELDGESINLLTQLLRPQSQRYQRVTQKCGAAFLLFGLIKHDNEETKNNRYIGSLNDVFENIMHLINDTDNLTTEAGLLLLNELSKDMNNRDTIIKSIPKLKYTLIRYQKISPDRNNQTIIDELIHRLFPSNKYCCWRTLFTI